MRSQDHFRTVHVGALALCAIFLPWSTAFLSMAQMLLVANWLTEGIVRRTWKQRFRAAFTTGPVLVFLSFLGLHVVGLLWTSHSGLPWGMDLLRILLPVLVFAVVLGSTDRLTTVELRRVLLLGAWSAVASTFVCLLLHERSPDGYRELSRFISHIRLTLLLCFAVAVFLHYRARTWSMLARVAAALWCMYFINKLGSIQGFIILGVLLVVVIWRALRAAPAPVRWSVRAVLVVMPIAAMVWAAREIDAHYVLPEASTAGYDAYSAGGEAYTFDATNPQMENGHHVWSFIAWEEMHRTWPRRSTLPLDGVDGRGGPLGGTLVRYLASKGVRKDSVSVMALTDDEVRSIESGVHNALTGQRSKLRERAEEVLYELGQYRAYGKANGHSVTMRLEFWKAGCAIAARHWWSGVGTGDTQTAFNAQYDAMDSSLSPEWRLRAHNEYLTLLISFGVFGLAWCLFTWWWPAFKSGAWRDPLFIAWAVIFGIGCLTDDTVETQAGATFFALYYVLLVFAAPRPTSGPAVAAPVRV